MTAAIPMQRTFPPGSIHSSGGYDCHKRWEEREEQEKGGSSMQASPLPITPGGPACEFPHPYQRDAVDIDKYQWWLEAVLFWRMITVIALTMIVSLVINPWREFLGGKGGSNAMTRGRTTTS
jgi:hypothetical protein